MPNPTGKGGFAKGRSANPGGRPKDTPLTNSLLKLLRTKDENGQKNLDVIAEVVVMKARAGDMEAIGFVWNRIEGKVPEPIALGGPGGGPIPIQAVRVNVDAVIADEYADSTPQLMDGDQG